MENRKKTIIIEQVAVKRKLDVALTETNIITYTTVSLFLPYILTAIILTFLSLYVVINKKTRQKIFLQKQERLLKLIFAYILVIPVLSNNLMGLLVGIGMVLILLLGLYIKNIMSEGLYEKILTLICTLSLTSAGYAILEYIVNLVTDGRHSHRIAAVFSHPNYFGTIIGTVIIICAYKILTRQENQYFYYMVAVINVFSIYLCKSMFVWVEVFLGITVLLLIMKKYRLLAAWLSSAVVFCILIFLLGLSLVPRLSDMSVTIGIRWEIWELAITQIKKSPWFGHGFLSFSHIYNKAFRGNLVPHSHNIYLDMLLNFGILGTAMIGTLMIKLIYPVFKACFIERKIMVNALIIAVIAAALVHGATDLTLFWIQTLPLFLIIVSGMGLEQKSHTIIEIKAAAAKLSHRS